MYKNQLQELAQRSCFNLPSYTCFREGPDHAPRFKAAVNFNGETFESPSHCSTLRQAEHSAAEVALNSLASRGPSNSLAARILDETGVYKNLLQEVSQRVGASLPAYTTFRTGQGHLPVFTGTVELAGVIFTGEPAKNKKQAEKNAAMAAWLSLKSLVQQCESSTSLKSLKDEQEHVTVAQALQKYLIKARLAGLTFPLKFPTLKSKPTPQQSPATTSKILPLIYPRTAPRNRPLTPVGSTPVYQKIVRTTQHQPITNETLSSLLDNLNLRSQKFPAAGAAPYIPVRHCNPHHRTAPPVTIRNTVPVFSAPPVQRSPALGMAPPVHVRQTVPVFSASPVRAQHSVKAQDQRVPLFAPARIEEPPVSRASPVRLEESVFAKHHLARLEEPVFVAPSSEVRVGQSELLASEIYAVQVKSPVSKTISSSASSQAPAEETRIAAQLEGLKDLKK